MEKAIQDKLIQKAADARLCARVPQSGFHVGAALLTATGDIITGCNVELKNMLTSICAERCAVTKAISMGYSTFTAIAVVSDEEKPIAPCGACRQFLLDFGADIPVIMATADARQVVVMTTGELSPMGFISQDLTYERNTE